MKVWKKLSAMALALMMVLALCAPAFAAAAPTYGDMKGDTSEDGVLGEFDTSGDNVGKVKATYSEKYILLYKEIDAANAEASIVNAPTIQYDYAVTSGTGSAENAEVTVKDSFGAQVQVNDGIVEAVEVSGAVAKTNEQWSFETGSLTTTGHLAFTPTVQLNNGKNVFPIKVDFSKVVFTGAGVYRYIITETVHGADTTGATDEAKAEAQTAAKNAAGIDDGAISNIRYLDVYVKDASSVTSETAPKDKYEIYGFVCFQNLQSPDVINGTTSDNNLQAVAKTEGFVADKDSNNTDQTADTYNTFNLTVSKTLVNDQAMKNNKFPFNVTITNASVTVPVILKATPTGTVTRGTETHIDGTTGDVSGTLSANIVETPSIADSGNIKYVGIPVGVTTKTSVSVYETNNVTGTTYTSTYQIDSDAATGSKVISWNLADDANKSNTATFTVTGTTARAITFINTLMNISPTGVTLRYAPYLAMLGAGVVALPLSLRKKKGEEI